MEREIQVIMQTFIDNNFQIYLVGGYVRDFLLGTSPQDADFATDARPEQIENLFPKTLALGKSFGTITIIGEQGTYEVTTFRRDVGSQNFRKPEQVVYATTLREDVARRDLTINGLAMTINSEIVDLVGGQTDLAARVIRTIGEPQQRFAEDALRILRAVRFASRLQFVIEATTLAAIDRCAKHLRHIAKERLRKEWELIVTAENYKRVTIPQTVAQVCFGESWELILTFPEIKHVSVTQFWAFVALVSGADWRYTKAEKRLAQLVQQRWQQPVSLRYLDLSEAEVVNLEQMIAAWQQLSFDEAKVRTIYQQQLIHSRHDLAVRAQDFEAIGLPKAQLQTAFFRCIQAINEQKIPNTQQACLAQIKEEYPWINN